VKSITRPTRCALTAFSGWKVKQLGGTRVAVDCRSIGISRPLARIVPHCSSRAASRSGSSSASIHGRNFISDWPAMSAGAVMTWLRWATCSSGMPSRRISATASPSIGSQARIS